MVFKLLTTSGRGVVAGSTVALHGDGDDGHGIVSLPYDAWQSISAMAPASACVGGLYKRRQARHLSREATKPV
jgi:hypothetical protein